MTKTQVATLTGNSSDDTSAISAGTGAKLSVSGASSGSFSGVATPLTTTGNLVAGKINPVDATAGALTASLPTGQPVGTPIAVVQTDNTQNTVTISGSIRGSAGTQGLNFQFRTVFFVADAAGSWWPLSDIKPGAYLNTIYAALAGATFTGEVVVPDLKVSGKTGATAASRYVGATTSGAPASGTFVTGDWIVDQTGKRWTCTAGGTPGTWAQEPGTGGGGGASTAATGPGGTVGGVAVSPQLVPPASNFGEYVATVTADTVFTIQAPTPAAGQFQHFVLRMIQDGTGGHNITIQGDTGVTVVYPGATFSPNKSANGETWVEFFASDASKVEAFPGTSAASSSIVVGTNYPIMVVNGTGVNEPAVANDLYLAQIVVPAACTLTGIEFLVANTGAANVVVGLYNAAGTSLLASSASTAVAGVNGTMQQVPFSSAYSAAAGTYFLALITSNNTWGVWAGWTFVPSSRTVAGSFALPASVTAPTAPAPTTRIVAMSTY